MNQYYLDLDKWLRVDYHDGHIYQSMYPFNGTIQYQKSNNKVQVDDIGTPKKSSEEVKDLLNQIESYD